MYARSVLLSVVIGCVSACSGAIDDDPRTVWLQNTLVQDNRPLMMRATELTRGKFRKMNLNPYFYFRGTAPQYWRDARGPGAWAVPTAFGTPETSDILLVGDPHPENVGSYKPADGDVTVDYNDFDASRRGPYHFDVRRLALGFWIAGATLEFDEEFRLSMAEAAASGYVDQIGETDAYRVSRNAGFGPVIDDLFRRAVRDGNVREALDEYTILEDGEREMFFGVVESPDVEGVFGDEVVELPEDERRFVAKLLDGYWHTVIDPPAPEARVILGMSRRLGAGVSSYPVLRWYVLVEGDTTEPGDDLLLEVKEIFDPPMLGDVATRPRVQYALNARRAVVNQRALQATETNDPLLGWAADGEHSFRVRHRIKFQKNVAVARLGEDLGSVWETEDLVFHAEVSGRLLAAAHRRGSPAAAEIIADVVDSAFLEETTEFAVEYGQQTLDDYERFGGLLESEGELLGYEADVLEPEIPQ